jgi:2-polyprenyl-3-methyl-5-hydroxy-6-metoxy-1,4-benzoquinol methylase
VDLARLYEYRFRDVDQPTRRAVWRPIAAFVWERLGRPERVLDPAAGRGEFISAVPARERWAVDRVAYPEAESQGIRFLTGDATEVELPAEHFDGVFVSNFLEHLPSPEAVAGFLGRMRKVMRPGGRIAVMGPNYRYAAREYWDCADHALALTHVAVEEHLYAAGFEPTETIPRFLPYSFRGRLPASEGLTRAYLSLPPLWRLFGKQFLVFAEKRGQAS